MMEGMKFNVSELANESMLLLYVYIKNIALHFHKTFSAGTWLYIRVITALRGFCLD